MGRTTELGGPPSLPRLMARAVATPARARGREVPDLEVTRRGVQVDPAALAAYDRVCGFVVRDRLPATYLHVLTFPLQVALFADRSYPYPLTGSVHLENTITQYRPALLGEPLDLSVQARDARTHRRGATVDLVGTVRVGQELVWEGVSTYLYRGASAPGPELPRSEEGPAPEGAGATWRLTGDLGRRYARVSGDVNPIHMNPLAARALGFPRTIAHGMWSKAAMLGALDSRLPEAFVASVSFRKPVLLPGTVRFVARPDEGGEGFEMALTDARKGLEHARGHVRPVAGTAPISR